MNAVHWDAVATLAGVAFAVATVVTGAMLVIARRARLLDVPNARSSHEVPTPRSGGVGIVAGIAAALLWLGAGPAAYVFLAAACAVGFADDVRAMRASVKMTGLLAAAAAAAFVARADVVRGTPYADTIALGVLAWPLTVFWLACFPNAFNFMDGVNGIAAVTAAVSGAAFATAGLVAGDEGLAVLGVATAAAALGFLPWNFPRASIFMGDAGSLPLGMALAVCALLANTSGALPFPASMLVLGPFIFDVSFTLVRRAARGAPLGEAHKEHLYQRLSRVWRSHAKVTLLYGAFSVATAWLALGYAARTDAGKLLSLVLPVAALLAFAALVLRAERSKGG